MGKWLSPKPSKCDICKITLQKTFTDGATLGGPWAIMCESCAELYGRGYGIGKGQQFDLETLECLKGGRER